MVILFGEVYKLDMLDKEDVRSVGHGTFISSAAHTRILPLRGRVIAHITDIDCVSFAIANHHHLNGFRRKISSRTDTRLQSLCIGHR